MSRSFLLFLLSFVNVIYTGNGRLWVPLRTKGGDWLAVREVTAGNEYWLRPQPEVEAVSSCRRCRDPNIWAVKVRFWREKDLMTAQTCLRDQGYCKAADPCRVVPFQAARIAVLDQLGRLEPLRTWLEVSGPIPATQEFAIRRKNGGGHKAARNDSVELKDLAFFDVTIVSAIDATSGVSSQAVITFTEQDMRWALRFSNSWTAKSRTLVSQAFLSKLAARIYNMKASLSGQSLVLTPSLRTAIERRLIAATVAFRPGMETFLSNSYRATPGELLFVLRDMLPGERVAVSAAPEGEETLRIALAAASVTKVANGAFTVNRTAEKVEKESSTARVQRLEEAQEAYQQQLTSILMALNNSRSTSAGIPLLRQQVTLLANAINASHLLQPSTMSLTAVEDCWEAWTRGLGGGLFFLRPFRRIVLCTGAGELVVLRRTDGGVNFNASWDSYRAGLGKVESGDFFLGLDFLANYTNQTDTCMKLLLTPWRLQHKKREAEYDSFQVAPAEDGYRMNYADFKGTVLKDILAVMKGQRFSTYDNDNDQYVGSCAAVYASGNWFNSCRKSNIFGQYKKTESSGMCSQSVDASQGDMCSPLTAVHMLLKNKKNAQGSRKAIFSTISSQSCSATLKLFVVPETGLYTFTVGGAPGAKPNEKLPHPGGRGAKVRAEVLLQKGAIIGTSAGCPGDTGEAGDGGDASWVVDRSKGILLVAAGGGGGGGDSDDGDKVSKLPGIHGQASNDGSDGWRNVHYTFSGTVDAILRKVSSSYRGKGWTDLRHRLLFESSGSLRSGAGAAGGGGGGGGGFRGGFNDPLSASDASSGGGGGSFCNETEASFCSLTTGGNGDPVGYVIIEKNSCF